MTSAIDRHVRSERPWEDLGAVFRLVAAQSNCQGIAAPALIEHALDGTAALAQAMGDGGHGTVIGPEQAGMGTADGGCRDPHPHTPPVRNGDETHG